MRYVKWTVVAVLVVSLIANYILVQKTQSRRTHVKINDKTYTKRVYYDWLEKHYGTQVTADLVKYELITQAAERANCKADANELTRLHDDTRDSEPVTAARWNLAPWMEQDWRQAAEMALDLRNLSIKDVPATDDQLRQFYDQNPRRWDTPERIRTKVVVARTQADAEKAKELMERVTDMSVVAQQLQGQVQVQGVDGTYMFKLPFGGKSGVPWMDAVTGPNSIGRVFVQQIPGDNRNPVRWIAIRREKRDDKDPTPKHRSFEEAKADVARDFKLTRAAPASEVLRKLWDQATIETDDRNLKDTIERYIFQTPQSPMART